MLIAIPREITKKITQKLPQVNDTGVKIVDEKIFNIKERTNGGMNKQNKMKTCRQQMSKWKMNVITNYSKCQSVKHSKENIYRFGTKYMK